MKCFHIEQRYILFGQHLRKLTFFVTRHLYKKRGAPPPQQQNRRRRNVAKSYLVASQKVLNQPHTYVVNNCIVLLSKPNVNVNRIWEKITKLEQSCPLLMLFKSHSKCGTRQYLLLNVLHPFMFFYEWHLSDHLYPDNILANNRLT